MKFTNKKNLPEIVVRAVTNDPYDKGDSDYSVTQLIKPAYQNMLQRKHADDIVEDVSERLWSLYGQAAHHIIERSADGDDAVEDRFFARVDGKKISGQIDHRSIVDNNLSDWKLTSAYKVKKALQGDFEDWEQQLNMQAYLLLANDIEVDKLYIGAMVRDWTPFSHKTEEGYPDQVEYIEIPKWPSIKTLRFMIERIDAMENPEPCSQAERWQPDPSFAVMKKGGTRALKVESSLEDAFAWCEAKGFVKVVEAGTEGQTFVPEKAEDLLMMVDDGHEIVKREGPNRRCENYCNVKDFCQFYKDTYAKPEDLPFKNS